MKNMASLITDALKEVDGKKQGIDLLCRTVAQFMEELHGGSFRIQIEHDVGLVAIVRRLDGNDPTIKPSDLREAV
ncbi:hypothetical protein ACTDI4_02470 [Mesorhizobium sp. PUT5]|uniref:hypothetical protein n=1 Tax=Mesorhizobium sp. PUT5 TaxID=3454629 RepID=UPI003FA4ADAD